MWQPLVENTRYVAESCYFYGRVTWRVSRDIGAIVAKSAARMVSGLISLAVGTLLMLSLTVMGAYAMGIPGAIVGGVCGTGIAVMAGPGMFRRLMGWIGYPTEPVADINIDIDQLLDGQPRVARSRQVSLRSLIVNKIRQLPKQEMFSPVELAFINYIHDDGGLPRDLGADEQLYFDALIKYFTDLPDYKKDAIHFAIGKLECPIHLTVMSEPVEIGYIYKGIAYRHVYERSALVTQFCQGNLRDPLTNHPLDQYSRFDNTVQVLERNGLATYLGKLRRFFNRAIASTASTGMTRTPVMLAYPTIVVTNPDGYELMSEMTSSAPINIPGQARKQAIDVEDLFAVSSLSSTASTPEMPTHVPSPDASPMLKPKF